MEIAGPDEFEGDAPALERGAVAVQPGLAAQDGRVPVMVPIRHLAASAAALAPRMISVAQGLNSVHNRSMRRAGWARRRGLRAYPSSLSADSTRTRVAAATSARPLSTFDTVGTETSAAAAMAAIVTRFSAVFIALSS